MYSLFSFDKNPQGGVFRSIPFGLLTEWLSAAFTPLKERFDSSVTLLLRV